MLGSLSNESVERVDQRAKSLRTEDETVAEGATEAVEVVENAARDVIDALEDVAEYVAVWISDAAEDVRDRTGHRRSRGRWKTVEVQRVQFLARVVGVPVVLQRQVPQERVQDCIVEETVACVEEETTEVVKHGSLERVLNYAVEQCVDVPHPLIQEETVEVIPLTRQNQTPGRIRDEIAEKKDYYEMSYEQFVKCMKLGIRENSVDDFEIAELLRFNTSKSGDEQISFKNTWTA